MKELDKLDHIDRKVVVWCAENTPHELSLVLEMQKRDYKNKGVDLDITQMKNELNEHLWDGNRL